MKKISRDRSLRLHILFLVIIALVFALIITWPRLPQALYPNGTATPIFTPTITMTPTELPTTFPNVIPDFFTNRDETSGLLIGSGLLVLVVLIGVLISIRNNEK